MKKLNWSCTICGMSSGRKDSVRRHIENPNFHNGAGEVISFVDYSIGRRNGYFQGEHVGAHSTSRPQLVERILVKIEAEFENLVAKEIAQRIYDHDFSTNNQWAQTLEGLGRSQIVKNNLYKIIKGSMS